MKIIKYLLMLAVLATLALSVYIYTRPSMYTFELNKHISAPKSVVYSYISDYKTWPLWFGGSSTANNKTIEDTTSYAWSLHKGESGLLKTILLAPDSIKQLLTLEGLKNENVSWKLYGSRNETELHLGMKATLDFNEKVKLFIKGTTTNQLTKHFEIAIQRLDSLIVAQMKEYRVNDNGVISFGGFNYVYTEITCAQSELNKEIEKAYVKLRNFLNSQNAKTSGSTFHVYKVWDDTNKTTTFAACMPTNDTISGFPESSILKAQLPNGLYHKTTLMGDYANLAEAWAKSDTAVSKLEYKEDSSKHPIEVYAVSLENTENPAQWITYILRPLKPLDTVNLTNKN